MTTTVSCHFVTPTGDPIINAPVEFQPAKSGYSAELDGVIMPRAMSGVTNASGVCVVELWPSPIPYYVRCDDPLSEVGIFYKIVVPVVPALTVLRLQDLVIEGPYPGAVFAGITFEVLSNTQLALKVRGSDSIVRSVILTLS